MTIYVVRHGETDWNRKKLMQGTVEVPLNEAGRSLARHTAEGFKRRGIHFDIAISSTYSRAIETAHIIADDESIPYIEDERIHEISWGDWEGENSDGDDNPLIREQLVYFFGDNTKFTGAPNGEIFPDVMKRVGSFVDDLLANEEMKDKTILIATHGMPFRTIQSIFKPSPKGFWRGTVPLNCAVTKVELKDGKLVDFMEDTIFYDESLVEDFYTIKELM